SLLPLHTRAGAAPAASRVRMGLVAVVLVVLHRWLAGQAWASSEPGTPAVEDTTRIALGSRHAWGYLLDWAQLLGLPAALAAALDLALLAGVAAVLFVSWRTQRLAAIAIRAAQGGSSAERWRTAV